MTEQELSDAAVKAKQAAEWLGTPEGRASVEQALREAKEWCDRLWANTRPTWEQLNTPMTI